MLCGHVVWSVSGLCYPLGAILLLVHSVARKSTKSKCAKLSFVRMHEQMADSSPERMNQQQGKRRRKWMENYGDVELQSGSFC